MPSVLRFWTQWNLLEYLDKTALFRHILGSFVSTGTMRFALIPVQLRYEVFRGHWNLVLKKSVERKTIMSYITVQEAAKKWGISERLARRYCAEGRIPDLAQYDGIWQIPEDAAAQRQLPP